METDEKSTHLKTPQFNESSGYKRSQSLTAVHVPVINL